MDMDRLIARTHPVPFCGCWQRVKKGETLMSSEVLYFVTDTTAQYRFRLPQLDPEQPNMIRLAFWRPGSPDGPQSFLVRPGLDWTADPASVAIHGITLEIAREDGTPMQAVVQAFITALEQCEFAACYNSDFHQKIIELAAVRVGIRLAWPRRPICLMREATPVVRKPRMQPGGGFSYPKLAEAVEFFTMHPMAKDDLMEPEGRGIYVVECLAKIHDGIIADRKAATR